MNSVINPDVITDFGRTDEQLQELVLFCIIVAGKSAHQQAKKLEEFLHLHPSLREGKTPFQYISTLLEMGILRTSLEKARLGQYTRLEKAFSQVIPLDLRTCTPEELESIPGIGMKTSRFFIVHSRELAEYAVLDTHILKYIRDVIGVDTPRQTPAKRKYLELEKIYLEHAKCKNMSLAELDLKIWVSYRIPKQN